MKYFLFVALFLFSNWAFAQNDSIPEINPLLVAEESPRFPGCEMLMEEDKNKCSEQKLLKFIYENIVYPDTAVANGIEGTVVIRFVVTKSGRLAMPEVLKDIGYGCAEEAMRVLGLINIAQLYWTPGKVDGEAVDVYYTVPIRFKIQEPLPYILMGRDTIWTEYTQAPSYKGGEEALRQFIVDNMQYPASGLDSCEVGDIAAELLIRRNGEAIVMSTYNYAGLSLDFEFEVARLATRTTDQWNIAQLDGKEVDVLYPVRFSFKPEDTCATKAKIYEAAKLLGNEGLALYNEGKVDEALAKWDESLKAYPQSVEVNYWRGQAYLEANKLEEACADFKRVKEVLGSSGYDNLLPFICK